MGQVLSFMNCRFMEVRFVSIATVRLKRSD
jgi:hypothetical protein